MQQAMTTDQLLVSDHDLVIELKSLSNNLKETEGKWSERSERSSNLGGEYSV